MTRLGSAELAIRAGANFVRRSNDDNEENGDAAMLVNRDDGGVAGVE